MALIRSVIQHPDRKCWAYIEYSDEDSKYSIVLGGKEFETQDEAWEYAKGFDLFSYEWKEPKPYIKAGWVKCSKQLPLTGDYYYVKIDTKQDSILRTICEWGSFPNGQYDWDYKGIQHFKDLKPEAEVIEWLNEEGL